jgi:hypothetical protein
MAETDKLRELLGLCKCEFFLSINQHRNFYMTAADRLKELEEQGELPSEITDEKKNKMIVTDTIINLSLYSKTPVGFFDIYHYDIDLCLEEALLLLKNET